MTISFPLPPVNFPGMYDTKDLFSFFVIRMPLVDVVLRLLLVAFGRLKMHPLGIALLNHGEPHGYFVLQDHVDMVEARSTDAVGPGAGGAVANPLVPELFAYLLRRTRIPAFGGIV